MKRILIILLAALMVASALMLSACKSEKEQQLKIKDPGLTEASADKVISVGDTVSLLNGMTVNEAVEKAKTDYTAAENLKVTQTVTFSLDGEETKEAVSELIKSGENLYLKNSVVSENFETECWLVDGVMYAKYGEMQYKLDLNGIKELIPEDVDFEELFGISEEDALKCIPEFDPSEFTDSAFTFDGDGYHADIVVNSEKITEAVMNSPASEYIRQEDIPDDIDIRYSFDASGNLDRIEEKFSVEIAGKKAEVAVAVITEEISADGFVQLPEDAGTWTDMSTLIPFMYGGDFFGEKGESKK